MVDSKEYLDKLRHSTAHLLASAVLELYPQAKLAIGPAIENGFYYDIDFGDTKISEQDLPRIEDKMRELIPNWKSFKKRMLTAEEAKAEYGGNPYKEELIDEFSKGGKEKISFYESVGSHSSAYKGGAYWDLCRGGHVERPGEEIKHFKLLSLAGAYWRGSEKNPMLTRIYGTAFPSEEELSDYLEMLVEAEARNHKKLGAELELFMFHETSPGMPYWLPKGVILYNELIRFWREEHAKRGYQEIATPLLNKKELYEISGHFEHYWDEMFVAKTEDGEYGVKAMNCPNAHIVFAHKTRSYKEFPLRLGDTDTLHRYERSGTLNGLLRVREFRQDDAHIYVTEEQIESEYKEVFEIVKLFYGVFGMEYSFRLGTRDPENFMGDIKTWNAAEETLKKILKDSGVEYFVKEGDGAFYGPKVDILMKDALGREWQMGTVQLDFQQPRRFGLTYVAADGSLKTPIAIHRVIYGSMERFIGILIEHFAGALPPWISPVQVMVLPITDKNLKYAQEVTGELSKVGIRASLDARSETLQSKIRDSQLAKVPYMAIVGGREEEKRQISLRLRNNENKGEMDIDDFIVYVVSKLENRAIDL